MSLAESPAAPCPEPTLASELAQWIDLDQLLERCMGNAELADRLVGRFVDGLAGSTRRICEAAACADIPGLETLAHRLRGEAANLGAVAIADLAARSEALCRQRTENEAIASADDLISACQDLCGAARLSGSAASPSI